MYMLGKLTLLLLTSALCVCFARALMDGWLDDDIPECIRPSSRRKCRDVYDCCETGKPTVCFNYMCLIVKDCYLKGYDCDYDHDCCSRMCVKKDGRDVCA